MPGSLGAATGPEALAGDGGWGAQVQWGWRSRAAGKSVPPSFCQAIWGLGWPVAAHSRRAVVPVRMAMSWGILVKEGNTAGQTESSVERWVQRPGAASVGLTPPLLSVSLPLTALRAAST